MALDEDQLAEIRDTFAHFDKDKNGSIDVVEFASLLAALGAEMTPDEVDIGMRAIDEDDSGFIDFDEFLAWWSDR